MDISAPVVRGGKICALPAASDSVGIERVAVWEDVVISPSGKVT